MNDNTTSNIIKYSRFNDLPGLELLRSKADTRFVARHIHELFCLTTVETGVRICKTRRGNDYFLTPGAIFVSNCGEAHSGRVPLGHTYSCSSLRLDPKLVASLASKIGCHCPSLGYLAKPLLFDHELHQKITQLHRTLNELSSTLSKEYQLLDVFAILFTRYTQARTDLPRPGHETAPVRRVCEYLQDCFTENVSINKLSSIAALSPFHLCRVFEREIGVPPHVYQLDIRLIRAAQMLAQGKPIADVAAETGFYDQSHFHKAFQRKFGITPKRYAH
ncbi:MAG: rhaS 3 [Sporomusa sp.]|nr:rhaS 3 [Sporomusa sp.]